MLNGIFLFLILISVLLAAATGQGEALTDAIVERAGKAVELAIGLVGLMAFFIGLMKVAQDAGLMRILARAVSPVMRKLFPSVPSDHPAMSAMLMNIGANMLGLANAATPFGIKAIEELDKLNGKKGTATNAMVLFLAINTAGLALLPSGVMSLRASLGSQDVAGIFFPTWFASGTATVVGVTMALLLARLTVYRKTEPPVVQPTAADVDDGLRDDEKKRRPRLGSAVNLVFWVLFLFFLAREVVRLIPQLSPIDLFQTIASHWLLGALVAGILLFGWSRGVRVYESLVEGAKEGFNVALRIIPYLVAILVAVGMFRAAGGIDLLVGLIGSITDRIGMPAEALPMAFMRPLSGSGAFGIAAEVMSTHGPDSFVGYMVSTFQGSTETTFYVLAVYFGAVGVKRTRHAVPACLCADVAGILAAVFIVNLLFG